MLDSGAAAPAEEGPCKVLADDRQAEVTRVKAVSENKDPLGRSDAVSDEVHSAFVRCTKTKKGGAWGFSLRDVKTERNGVTGVAVAIYVDSTGKKQELALKGPGRLDKRSFSATDLDRVTITAEQVFDYDGDGEDEFIAYGLDQTKEGIKELLSWVLTLKGGAIQPYAPANNFPIARVEDVDHDGRPDLVGYGPYRTRVPARCNGEPAIAFGPSLMLHSIKDGTFAIGDETAIKFVKQSCHTQTFEIARDEEKKVDDEQTFENVACARMWGVAEGTISATISNQCRPVSGEAACKEEALKSCGQTQQLLQWVSIKPPLKLK